MPPNVHMCSMTCELTYYNNILMMTSFFSRCRHFLVVTSSIFRSIMVKIGVFLICEYRLDANRIGKHFSLLQYILGQDFENMQYFCANSLIIHDAITVKVCGFIPFFRKTRHVTLRDVNVPDSYKTLRICLFP